MQSLESNAQLSFATRVEDWTCLGQHKRHPEFPVVTRESRRNSRKTTWLARHRKMKPFPPTAPQEKSHVRNWIAHGMFHKMFHGGLSCDHLTINDRVTSFVMTIQLRMFFSVAFSAEQFKIFKR